MTKTVELLRELIAMPSVNPAFLSPGDPYAGEQHVAEFLAARARRAGLDVEFQRVYEGRSNLLARLSPLGKARQRLLLAPHLDTVGGSSLPGQFFTPRMRNGRLHGRGACDTKASVAVMVTALEEMARSPGRPQATEVVFAGLVDEECLQGGSRTLAGSGFKADLAIVGEPTRLKVVTAHKGVMWLELKTLGRAAHGARPELGRNAAHTMARVVDVLLTEYAATLRRMRHPVLRQATISVGSIHGGRQPNVVPHECVCTIDRRMLPGERDAEVWRDMNRLLRRRGLRVEKRPLQNAPCVPLEADISLPLVQQLLRAARQRGVAGVDFFSDAGVLADRGTPSVLFGPGDIAQAHTHDEWIELDQVERARELLLRFMKSLP